MKKILLVCCIMWVQIFAYAQPRQINFEEGSFKDALTKAKDMDRLLFLDAYTSWCGPCKTMAKEVFTLDSIADFFNSHLVSLKMDMEKGEGIQLKEKYQIEVYPTFLLLNGDGQEVYRMVGSCSPDRFLSSIKKGMAPENSMLVWEERYKEGERSADFIEQYSAFLAKSCQLKQLQQVVEDFFKDKSVEQICQEENWKIYDLYVKDINSDLFHKMVDEVELFKELKGVEVIDKKLSDEYVNVIFSSISGHEPLSESQSCQYEKDIRKMNIQDEETLFYLNSYLYLATLRAQKKYDTILDICEAGPKNYAPERKATIVMSLIFLTDGTKEQRLRGIQLLKREAEAEKKRSGTLPPNVDQVLGYIFYKLKGEDIK